jgi:hypothetical protein
MKLSPRERVLALTMAGIVIALLNLMLLNAFARQNTALRSELQQRRSDWAAMQQLLSEQKLWADRDAALTAKQPKLTNETAVGPELLETVGDLAKQHSMTLENEVIGGVVNGPRYRSVSVTVDAHSSWPNLIAFLYALQKPDRFIVCQLANIQVDPSDQTKMLSHFTIARWYAPRHD